MRRGLAGALVLTAATGAPAAGQPPAQPAPPSSGVLLAPPLVARGVPVVLRGTGVPAGAQIAIELRRPRGWVGAGTAGADSQGRYRFRFRPRRIRRAYRFRALAPGAAPSPSVRVATRLVTLAAVGDINLGNGVAAVMYRRGYRFPWSGVAPVLRRADVAFGNLECAVSTRGSPVPKEYNFRGRPAALRAARRYAGMDVVNLANNHVGDFGTAALLDTLAYARRFGLLGVGAGRTLRAALRPRVIERLGLRIAFVGFSDVVPVGFAAGPQSPGTAVASPALVRASVRRAQRRAHVVIATFHWGVERDTRPSVRQRALAAAARSAGAHAVIGAHPHVLQPVERRRRAVVAYSLGNFVWAAGSALTSSTGILWLRLSARGVEGAHLLRARIEQTRPRLLTLRR